MYKKFMLNLLLFFLLFSGLPISSEDWNDLYEGEKKKVYGSEKSKKYSTSNIFWEVERWDKHYGVRILHLYDYTDYPKYNSTEFIPFYNRLNSKIDNREKFRFLNYTFKQEKSNTNRSFFPLAFWGNNSELNSNYNSILPFYYYSNILNSTKEETKMIVFPFPYYYSYKNIHAEKNSTQSHFSLFHGRIIQKEKTTNQEIESSIWFPIIPLARYTNLENSYSHYIFPIYGFYKIDNSRQKYTEFAFSAFPFYYINDSYPIANNNRHFEITHWSLLHYRNIHEDKGEFKEYTHKSVWGFPVLPFLFYSSFMQGEGNYKRILTLIHWENSEKDEIKSFSFLPFIFYKKKDYFRIPILFIDKDLSSPNAAYGRAFVPFILYYNRWDPTGQTFVLGPWVSVSNHLQKESFETVFPIYWKSKSEKRDITFILPLYANYNDKENDFHFNLLLFTKSSSGLVKPELSVGKKEDKWYFDTDITLLYYLASFSSRQTLEKPKFFRNVLNRNKSYEEIEEDKKQEQENAAKITSTKEKDNPKLSRKKSIAREDSFNFIGYSALFGLFSYEAADTKRHLRLLPLSWLSWDKASEDKLIVAPPFLPLFVWYKSDALEYLVAFPFYGKQKEENSEKHAVLINAFISEKYKTENWNEKSVLWPFVNWYTSDKKSGHRVLPFYIHQFYKTDNKESNYNYTLFSYFNKTHYKENIRTNFFFWPLLTAYSSNTYKNPNESETNNDYTLWITPFFYRNSIDDDGIHTNIFWFIDSWQFNKKNNKSLGHLIVAPFYYFSDGDFGVFPLSFNRKRSDRFWTFTLFNYLEISEKNYYYNFLYLVVLDKTTDFLKTSLFLGGISYYNNPNFSTSFTGLWGFGWNFTKSESKWEEASILWYFGGGYRTDGTSSIYNLSVLFLHESNPKYFRNWTLGNYMRKSEEGFRNNFLFLVDYESYAKDNFYTIDFLLSGIQYKNTATSSSFEAIRGYGWNFSRTSGKWEEATFLSYLGGGYRLLGDSSIYNLSFLFYHDSNPDYYINWTLGNFRKSTKNGLRNNFLYLVDYESFASDNSYTWDFLFTGIRYHNLKQENYFQGVYGYAWNFRKENEIWRDATFLWLGYSHTKEETSYNFLPVIRLYDNSKDEHSRIYGPMLLYTSEEKGKNLHLGLFGLGYWYYKNESNKQDDTYILLGSLYREYTEKERGFRSQGSLWGWLWEHQKEDETGYEKYSILKLFSYTKEEDGTRKIFGITL